MLKILQTKLQQYMNWELPVPQAGLRKGRGTRDQIANICWIKEKAREFQRYFCLIDYMKAFDCVDHNKFWKSLKEIGISDHFTYLLRNLYADQETWKNGLVQNWDRNTTMLYIVTLFNLFAEYIRKNSQAELKSWNQDYQEKYQQPQICTWYHSNSRKWRGIKEPLDVKEESEKAGLKLNIQKTKFIASCSITSWQVGINGNSGRLYFLRLQNQCRIWLQPWNWKAFAPWKESYEKARQHTKNQIHHFSNKGMYNQSYAFSSSQVQMCELDHKEDWGLKNWCFWIVGLEKTLESPLDCKEIKSINLKGINTGYSLGGLMIKEKLQHIGHLMVRADLLKKILMLGKIEGRKRREWH